jgi:hypothetical protein
MFGYKAIYFNVICVDAEHKRQWSIELDFLHKPAAGDRLIIEYHPTKVVEVLEVALFSRNVRFSNSIKPKAPSADEPIAGLLIVQDSPLSIYEEIL